MGSFWLSIIKSFRTRLLTRLKFASLKVFCYLSKYFDDVIFAQFINHRNRPWDSSTFINKSPRKRSIMVTNSEASFQKQSKQPEGNFLFFLCTKNLFSRKTIFFCFPFSRVSSSSWFSGDSWVERHHKDCTRMLTKCKQLVTLLKMLLINKCLTKIRIFLFAI